MTAPTAVIAEDEPLLRAEIREAFRALWPELVVCAEAADGVEALQALRQYAPQVLILDIQMPGASGLDVAREASGKAHVVFVTAYDQYAVAAFEHGAIDYVQKPIATARLEVTVRRLKQRLLSAPADLDGILDLLKSYAGITPKYLKWLTVPFGQELRLVTTDEICYLRADNKYTSVFTAASEYLLSSTLKQMKDKLDPNVFWQIHRGIVVNVSAIQSIHRSFRGSLEVRLKQRREVLPVSAAHAHRFKHL